MASSSQHIRFRDLLRLRQRSRESPATRNSDLAKEVSATSPSVAESSVNSSDPPPDYTSVVSKPVPSINVPFQDGIQVPMPMRIRSPITTATTSIREDLWGQAAIGLDPRVIEKLRGVPQVDEQTGSKEAPSSHLLPKNDINEVLELTKERSKLEQTKALKRRWNSLIRSVSACKSLVDAGLQFDPTGYGALAWSVVSFGLQTAINNSNIQQAVFESTDYIRGVVDEYSMFEARYMEKPSVGHEALRSCIIDVYRAVINYVATLRYYLDHRLDRIGEALKGLQGSSFILFKATIEERRASARYIIYDIRNEYSEADLVAIESKIADVLQIAREISKISEYVSRRDDEEVLDWVSDVRMETAHKTQRNSAIAKGREKPGAWILNESAYLYWEAAESSTSLWLSGGVGTGKTILTSTVIEDRSGIYGKEPYGPVTFFYCTGVPGNGQKGVTAETIFGSILRQIMESSEVGLNLVRTKWRDEHKRRSLTQIEVLSFIQQIIEHQDTLEVTIVVDGLDELDIESLNGLLGGLSDLRDAAGILKIFAASRWVQRVEDFFGNGFRIMNSPSSTRSDIDIYIDTTVDAQLKKRRDLEEGLGFDIKSTLKERAQGMFRYVELAMKFIFEKSTRMIRQRLEELPKPEFGDAGLQPIYQKLYGLIEKDDRLSQLLAHRTIQWLLYQTVPLQSWIMIEGICTESTGAEAKKLHKQYKMGQITVEEVYAACHHLVIHNQETNCLEFGHFSVVEFLNWLGVPTFSRPVAHSTLAIACLHLLLSEPSHTSLQPHYRISSEDYADFSWGWHCKNAMELGNQHLIYEFLARFCNEGNYFRASLSRTSRVLHLIRGWETKEAKVNKIWTALDPGIIAKTPQLTQRWLVACAFDLVTLIRDILDKKSKFVLSHSMELVAGFKLALFCGSINTAQILLAHGTSGKLLSGRGITVLHHAAHSMNAESLKRFIPESSESINAVAVGARQVLWKTTPLIIALGSINYGGQLQDMEPIKVLLGAPGIDIHARGALGETAMHVIASSFLATKELVELALNTFATDIYCRDNEGNTPMAIARERADRSSEFGNEYISDQWAELGPLATEKGLIFNSYNGSQNLQMFLDVERPLHAAARTGDLDELKHIISRDNSAADRKHHDLLTALFLAAENGNVDSAQFLLDTGPVDVNAQDSDGFSVLMVAMLGRPSSARLIRLLRARGASAAIENCRGRNAFFFAIEKGNLDTVKALFSYVSNAEIDINHQDSVGSTPLHYAYGKKLNPPLPWSYEQKTNIIDFLLGCHAQPNIKNKLGQMPSQVTEQLASFATTPIPKNFLGEGNYALQQKAETTIGLWQSFAPIAELPLMLTSLYGVGG